MTSGRRRKKLESSFGKRPDIFYFPGDLQSIRAYYDFRRKQQPDAPFIDEITWNDLDLDDVFRRINSGLTTSGEQYLYYMLRSPAADSRTYAPRRRLIGLMEERAELRLRLQRILSRLGRSRRADLCRAFHAAQRGPFWLIVYLLLALLIPASAAAAGLFGSRGLLACIFAIVLNMIVHEVRKRRCQKDFDTVNYTVAMVFALRRVRKLRNAELDAELRTGYESLERLRSVLRTGGVTAARDDTVGDFLSSVFLLDLIAYEFLKNKLGRCHADVFAVHETLGRLDASIAVASYRASMGVFCEPELDFSPERAFLCAKQMVHPLLEPCVPNDLTADRPLLVTGSNASGKSTFLKTTALCALLAQAICTAPAQSYRASAFQIATSMALRDNLSGGESYYIVEVRSLRRILACAGGQLPLLCVVDEVLRGTNTVERIASSSRILEELAARGALCVAATHDVELCNLLAGSYTLCHFEEQVGEENMVFDYRLKPGRAESRNAINLLKLMGFDAQIVSDAHAMADRYMETGVWSAAPAQREERV